MICPTLVPWSCLNLFLKIDLDVYFKYFVDVFFSHVLKSFMFPFLPFAQNQSQLCSQKILIQTQSPRDSLTSISSYQFVPSLTSFNFWFLYFIPFHFLCCHPSGMDLLNIVLHISRTKWCTGIIIQKSCNNFILW